MTEPPSPFGKPFLLHLFDLHVLVWCVGPLGTAMRVRVLHAKLYAYALPGSTARQLFISLTLLDSSTATRQTSTDLDRTRRPGAWSQARQARQELDSNSTGSTGKASTAPRQRLDSASTEPRQLDSSTARAQLTR